MKSKENYMNELKKRLSILNDDEVADIASEYNDFLSRKMEDGYSLEESLEALGDVNELARRILEAYKISEKYIKWFVGKERFIDDINEYTGKVTDTSMEVFNKIESSVKDAFKKTVKFGGNRINDVKNIFDKKTPNEDVDVEPKTDEDK